MTRNQVIKDLNGLVQLPADIVRAIQATAENKGSNFLDNLVGTLRNTDANLIKYQEMNKQYKELKDLPDELKAENSKKLATDMANAVKSTYGIEDNVEIVINFTDQPKGDEMAAFVREDGKIEIYLNVKEVDVSNALGAELNHYNPSNPYVYDKTEEQAGKGNIQEELFTSIGRKPLDRSENSFYENILNGSNTLETGNREYSSIDEGKLDFCGYVTQCPGYKFDHDKKQSVPVEKKESSMTIRAGLGLDQISKNMNDFINNKNNYGNTGKNNSGSGRKEKVIVESNKTLNNKRGNWKITTRISRNICRSSSKSYQVPPGYSKENFDILVEQGYEAKYYDGADLLEYGVVTKEDYGKYMKSIGRVKLASDNVPVLAAVYVSTKIRKNGSLE